MKEALKEHSGGTGSRTEMGPTSTSGVSTGGGDLHAAKSGLVAPAREAACMLVGVEALLAEISRMST
jgi:hypothetical protein